MSERWTERRNKSQNDVRVVMPRTANCRRYCRLLGGQRIVDLGSPLGGPCSGSCTVGELLGEGTERGAITHATSSGCPLPAPATLCGFCFDRDHLDVSISLVVFHYHFNSNILSSYTALNSEPLRRNVNTFRTRLALLKDGPGRWK